jgi:hypothetical protein
VTVEGVPEGVDGGSADAPTRTPPAIDEPDPIGAGPAGDGPSEPEATDPTEPDAATDDSTGSATEAVGADDVTSAAADPDPDPDTGARAALPVAATEPAEPEAGGPAAADRPAAPPNRAHTPRRTRVRRGLAAAGVTLVVALSVSAFSMAGPTAANADQTFVDTARSQGHVVASGDQETLVVAAAHKICDRRESHSTDAERRATALSLEELGAVQQSFDGDVRGFTALALQTYCPN